MMFVTLMPALSAFRDDASGGNEEDDKSGKKKDFFHVQFILFSKASLRDAQGIVAGV
jgi:hypothetical protein